MNQAPNNSKKLRAAPLAIGGVFAALAVILMLLGGLVPFATYVCPMLASVLLIPLLEHLPKGLCWGWYGVVALLSALFCPDREAAFLFLFLGWYPIVRPRLERLPTLPRILVKLLIFNAAVAAAYGLLIFVFELEALIEEAREMGWIMIAALAVLGNVSFLLFDRLLQILPLLYRERRRKK